MEIKTTFEIQSNMFNNNKYDFEGNRLSSSEKHRAFNNIKWVRYIDHLKELEEYKQKVREAIDETLLWAEDNVAMDMYQIFEHFKKGLNL